MSSNVIVHPKASGMSFSPYHLKAILVLTFTDPEYRDKFFNILKPEHFSIDKNLYILAKGFWGFYERYGNFPSVTDFVEEVFVQKGKNINLFLTTPSQETLDTLLDLFLSLESVEADPNYIGDITTNVIKLSSVHRILSSYRDDLAQGTVNVDELTNEIVSATQLLNPVNLGINSLENLEKRTEDRLTIDVVQQVVPIGIPGISEFVEDGGLPKGTLAFAMAPPGVGKCLGIGTKVMLFDGTLKNVEDVVINDLLMGPDSKPKTVLGTTRGEGQLYKIIPTKGDPWVCNDVHVLTLIDNRTNKIIDIPLNKYLQKGNDFKHHTKLFIPEETSFPPTIDPLIDPYFLGLWFGDGNKCLDTTVIHSMDKEIESYCFKVAKKYGITCSVTQIPKNRAKKYLFSGTMGKLNPITNLLRKSVGENKDIPSWIKYGSINTRKQFLAGFIDTDGEQINNCFCITQKRQDYAQDIAFIARSLGLRVVEKKLYYNKTTRVKNLEESTQTYYKVCIFGDTAKIPTLLPRKQTSPRKQKKNARRTGFRVESLGVGPYAGFELDGDGRFLLGDFTVTHNTTFLITLSKIALLHNKKVLYISAELSLDVILKRMDSAFTGIPIREVRSKASKIREMLTKNKMYKRAMGNLRVLEVPIGSTTVRYVDSIVRQLDRKGWRPDLIAVDYADNLVANSKMDNSYRESYSIYRDLRRLAQENNCVVWTASQVNTEGIDASESDKAKNSMSLKHAAESRAKTHVSDFILGIARTREEREKNEARIIILKNRFGGNETSVVTVFPNFECSLMWTSNTQPKVYHLISDAVADNFNAPTEEGEISNETRALLYAAQKLDEVPVDEEE